MKLTRKVLDLLTQCADINRTPCVRHGADSYNVETRDGARMKALYIIKDGVLWSVTEYDYFGSSLESHRAETRPPTQHDVVKLTKCLEAVLDPIGAE